VADAVQTYAMQVVTHVPLGEWFSVGAARDDVHFPKPLPPVTVFWSVSKK
jgi:peptide/nickel transport system substrate-binding protein